jgi:tripartite-type tricarboxylate transporter receptor subunit TctC
MRAFVRIAFCGSSGVASVAQAQYPDRSITAIVPNAAGGALDIYAHHRKAPREEDPPARHHPEYCRRRNERVRARCTMPSQWIYAAGPPSGAIGIAAQGILVDGRSRIWCHSHDSQRYGFRHPQEMPFTDLKSMQAYGKANPGKLRMGVFLTAHSHYVALEFMEVLGIDLKMINVPVAMLRAALSGDQIDVMLATPSTLITLLHRYR